MHIVEEGGSIWVVLCTLIITMKDTFTLEERADAMRLTRIRSYTPGYTFKSPWGFGLPRGVVHLLALHRVLELLVLVPRIGQSPPPRPGDGALVFSEVIGSKFPCRTMGGTEIALTSKGFNFKKSPKVIGRKTVLSTLCISLAFMCISNKAGK